LRRGEELLTNHAPHACLAHAEAIRCLIDGEYVTRCDLLGHKPVFVAERVDALLIVGVPSSRSKSDPVESRRYSMRSSLNLPVI
jgi:hypothetical protein